MANSKNTAHKVTKEMQELVESELRRGTSKSRIATLLQMPYDEAVEVIGQVKESIRPEVGNEVKFYFRSYKIVGIIEKLLSNSAVVKIYWDHSDKQMRDVLEERAAVNFKDIDEFVHIKGEE